MTTDPQPGDFHCLYVDPPWHFATSLPGFGKKEGEAWKRPGSRVPYRTMTDAQIALLPVGALAHRQAHLYLWCPNAKIEAAYRAARVWGFTPSILLPWCKKPRGSAGFPTFAIQTEYLLFCRRGGLKPLRRWPTNWFDFLRGKHSAKPPGMRLIIEQVTPGPRLELFAREDIPGWSAWGDECDRHLGVDAVMQDTMGTDSWLSLGRQDAPALRRAQYGQQEIAQ